MRTPRWLLTTSVLAGVGLGLAACHDESPTAVPLPEQTVHLVLSQTSLTLKSGDRITLSAQLQRDDGSVLSRAISWSSSNVNVATVASTGATTAEVTAVAIGAVKVTASADGASASTDVQVQPTGALLGVAGGTVTSADGNFILEIPEGALEGPTDVVIVREDVAASLRLAASASRVATGAQAAVASAAADPIYVPGTGYRVEPLGLQLKKQARLTIRYNAESVPWNFERQYLQIRYHDRTQNQWRDCTLGTGQQNTVQASIQMFSSFGIYGRPTTRPVAAVVLVTPASVTLQAGDVVQLEARVRDTDGNILDTPIQWSVEDPSVAMVDAHGLLTAIADGTTSATAMAGGVQGSAAVTVAYTVASVRIAATPATLIEGESVLLAATVLDAHGNAVPGAAVTWTSLTPAVVTVDETGLLQAVSAGTGSVVAQSRGKADTVTVTVSGDIARIAISGAVQQALKTGATRQLTATAYNSSDVPVPAPITWRSSDVSIATVSASGLVTGVGSGRATITASAGEASATASVHVAGGGETTEETGNNMSWPVVFADGIGLTGLPVAGDPGVRPMTAENKPVESLPFWWEGNVPSSQYSGYYLQKTANTWRAEYIDGTGHGSYDADVQFGDNLFARDWNTTRPIRVEVALNATGVGTLKGYNMTLLAGQGQSEIQGTDGTTADFVPLIYVAGPTIVIERISGPDGSVLGQVYSGSITSEMNGVGRIIWGYQLNLKDWTPPAGVSKDGMYRIRFILPAGAKVNVTGVTAGEGTSATASVVSAKEAKIEVMITQ